jgi:hypothetical protein
MLSQRKKERAQSTPSFLQFSKRRVLKTKTSKIG